MMQGRLVERLVTIGACLFAVRSVLSRVHQDREAARVLERKRIEANFDLKVREQDYADRNADREAQLRIMGAD
jgi:hypothetical protein